jgi:hypothetical protein
VRGLIDECETPPGDLPEVEADAHLKSAFFAAFFFAFGFLAATLMGLLNGDTRVSPPVPDAGVVDSGPLHHRAPEWDPDEVIPTGLRHQAGP